MRTLEIIFFEKTVIKTVLITYKLSILFLRFGSFYNDQSCHETCFYEVCMIAENPC